MDRRKAIARLDADSIAAATVAGAEAVRVAAAEEAGGPAEVVAAVGAEAVRAAVVVAAADRDTNRGSREGLRRKVAAFPN